MSYDLYCYKSPSGNPSVDEAQACLDTANTASPNAEETAWMEQVARETIDQFPHLIRFVFDYDEIAKVQNISREEAEKTVQYIELYPKDDEDKRMVIIDIYRDNVSINFPFSISDEFTDRIGRYAVYLHEKYGLIIYDPQSDSVHGSDYMEPTVAVSEKKPWWKFW